MRNDAFIFEFQKIGHQIKVTAVDPVTGKEVITIGDSKATQAELIQLAGNKLRYVLTKL